MCLKPWKENTYYKTGKVAEISVEWLRQFTGNKLRKNKEQMAEFIDNIILNGIKEPLMLVIGQKDRRVVLGEGNHRLYAAQAIGYKKVPVRVLRYNKLGDDRGIFYDKMSRVPVKGYFPADSSPLEVFDDFIEMEDE